MKTKRDNMKNIIYQISKWTFILMITISFGGLFCWVVVRGVIDYNTPPPLKGKSIKSEEVVTERNDTTFFTKADGNK